MLRTTGRVPKKLIFHTRSLLEHVASTVPSSSSGGGVTAGRSYHASASREIVPLVGAAVVFLVGRYSWRALGRMDDEWEEYQWQLQQYERQLARTQQESSTLAVQTLAVDMGSIYTKLAVSHPRTEIIVSRQGERYVFNGLIYPSRVEVSEENPPHRDRAALERFFFPFGRAATDYEDNEQPTVALPYQTSGKAGTIISDLLSPVLADVLDRVEYPSVPNDEEGNDESDRFVRKVVTLPLPYIQNQTYQEAFWKLANENPTVFIPDAVASVWGAQHAGLIPTEDDLDASRTAEPQTVVVIDVGGDVTQCSVVERDVIRHSISLPWGGETMVRVLVEFLAEQAPTPLSDTQSRAALQLEARRALVELTFQSHIPLRVPYVLADPNNPHLEVSLSRSVLEQRIQSDLVDHVIPTVNASGFSRHLPTPTDVASLFASTLTELLEQSGATPMSTDRVLLVGGASQVPVVAQGIQRSLELLMGNEVAQSKLVIPESASQAMELTVMGATTLPTNYVYDPSKGLVRI